MIGYSDKVERTTLIPFVAFGPDKGVRPDFYLNGIVVG